MNVFRLEVEEHRSTLGGSQQKTSCAEQEVFFLVLSIYSRPMDRILF
jgi:hypothetical protein